MSNADFQARLQRIQSKSGSVKTAHIAEAPAFPDSAQDNGIFKTPNVLLLLLGIVLSVIGFGLLANTELGKEHLLLEYGIPQAIPSKPVALCCYLLGSVLILRSCLQDHIVKSQGGGIFSKNKVKRKPNGKLFLAGSVPVSIGIFIVKRTAEGYFAYLDRLGSGTLIGLAIIGTFLFLVGAVVVMFATATAPALDVQQPPKRKASGLAKAVCSLLGVFLGGFACLYMFLSSASRFIDTEIAQSFSTGGFAIAILFLIIALAMGFIGLFIEGSALGRIPAYFFMTGVLMWSCFRIFRINVLEWEWFVTFLIA